MFNRRRFLHSSFLSSAALLLGKKAGASAQVSAQIDAQRRNAVSVDATLSAVLAAMKDAGA